jgi:soluble lytic murein transglycosylase-like protein
MKRKYLLNIWLAACALLQVAPAARAQSAERLAAVHAQLVRAAEQQIALAQEPSPAVSSARARKISGARPLENPDAADATLSRLNVARHRLAQLGVDAPRIFREEGVPLELLAVAEVESAFDPRALSPRGARGLWQFMPATAVRFGLRVEGARDERTLPAPATRAAARYLRELYARFGDWRLALAAYNAGEGRIEQAIRRGGTRDFVQLAALGLLPEETRRYVPAVLATKGE